MERQPPVPHARAGREAARGSVRWDGVVRGSKARKCRAVLLLATVCHASLLGCAGDAAPSDGGHGDGGARSGTLQETGAGGRAGRAGYIEGPGGGQDGVQRAGARGMHGYDPRMLLRDREQANGQEWLQRRAEIRLQMQGDTSLRAGGVGGRRAVSCADCGPRCISTKIAKPMRGECVGPTPVKFYDGEEVKAGQPLWRVQYKPMRSCVQTEGQANRRSGQREKGLQQMAPSLLQLGVGDAQDYCRSFWQDLQTPPTFYHTCNDPLFTEEVQMTGYTLADFNANYHNTFKQSVAAAMMNLKQNNSELVVTSENVVIARTFEGTSCKDGGTTLQGNPCLCQVFAAHHSILHFVAFYFLIQKMRLLLGLIFPSAHLSSPGPSPLAVRLSLSLSLSLCIHSSW